MKQLSFYIVSLCVILAACVQKPERNPNTLVQSSIGDARRLNPLLANDSASGTINELIFNGLVKYDKDIQLIGDLRSKGIKCKRKVVVEVLNDVRDLVTAGRIGVEFIQ